MSDVTLKEICKAWHTKCLAAEKQRDKVFGKFARECLNFYDGDLNHMWESQTALAKDEGFLDSECKGMMPKFKLTVNRAFEVVSLFGPSLFHQYPNILVEATLPPELYPEAFGIDPANPYQAEAYNSLVTQQNSEFNVRKTHASIRGAYLNRIQREQDARGECWTAVTDSLTAGLGIVCTDVYQPPSGSLRYPRSSYYSWENFVQDPDAAFRDDVQWIAIKCVHPRNIVEDEYNLPRDTLKGKKQSKAAQSTRRGRSEAKRGINGQSYDLVEYWKIWSKNGFGHYLNTFTDKPVQELYDAFGPYCYLVIHENTPYPLNMPPWLTNGPNSLPFEELSKLVEWPIPFWTDPQCGGGWPTSQLFYYSKPGCVWPIPPLKPCIGEIKFVSWCMSFLADKTSAACTDYVLMLKGAAAEIKDQLESGTGPFKMIEVAENLGVELDKLVKFIQAPTFHADIWKMVASVLEEIDRRSGVTPLLAGMNPDTQIRSAEEANIRQNNTQIRPDHMARCFEDFYAEKARKEMIAAMWKLERQDYEPVVGALAAQVWEQQMSAQPFESVVRDFQYSVEAGSARKPNLKSKEQSLMQMGQALGSAFEAMAMAGIPGPWNAYTKAICQTLQLDSREFTIPPPDPNTPQPPSEEEIKAQESQQELAMDGERLKMELFGDAAKLDMEREKHQMELAHDSKRFTQEMRQDKAKSAQEIAIQKQKGKAQVQVTKAQARAKPSSNGSRT